MTQSGNHIAHQIKALNAVDGLLHVDIEVLNADAGAVKAAFHHGIHQIIAGRARVHFNGDFGVGQDVDLIADFGHDGAQIIGAQDGWAAAAKMNMRNTKPLARA